MKSIKIHGPVLLLALAVTFAIYGRLLSSPLFSPVDFEVLQDAHTLSANPFAMFRYISTYLSQPVLLMMFIIEFSLFCLDPTGYIFVNLVIHALNAFMVYMVVNMLFARKNMAILAMLLFACSVGSYGKILMSVSQLEPLLLAHFQLLVLYFLIRNDFRHQGRIRSPYFLLGLGIFLLAGLTKASTFSLLGCLLAYKFFFYRERGGRAVFSRNLVILIIIGVIFYAAKSYWASPGHTVFGSDGSPLRYTWISIKNIFRYFNLMLFPLQPSGLVSHSNAVVQFFFEARTVIRVGLTLACISYSFFGIVFGSRPLRFFIAWTYITLLPFTSITPAGEWLNLQHLYLTSLGFCIILAAGTRGTCGLLKNCGWRRFVPYLVPLAFAVLAVAVSFQIDRQNRRQALKPHIVAMREQLAPLCEEAPAVEPTPASESPAGR